MMSVFFLKKKLLWILCRLHIMGPYPTYLPTPCICPLPLQPSKTNNDKKKNKHTKIKHLKEKKAQTKQTNKMKQTEEAELWKL